MKQLVCEVCGKKNTVFVVTAY